jgi:hypothetical protein
MCFIRRLIFLFLNFISVFSCLNAAAGKFLLVPVAANDSTPFVVRMEASALEPLESYEFAVWVYDREHRSAISQTWTYEGWKYAWYGYQSFKPDTGEKRCGWAFLRIYKKPYPACRYYIKFKVKDLQGESVIENEIEYPEFRIIDMQEEGGWLSGRIFADSTFMIPCDSTIVLAKNRNDEIVSSYISEDNEIDEGAKTVSGNFTLAVPSDSITALEFWTKEGSILGVVPFDSSYAIAAGETTYVSDVFPFPIYISSDINFQPSILRPGDDVEIGSWVYNLGSTVIENIEVNYYYNRRSEATKNKIGTILIDYIAPRGSAYALVTWADVKTGNYEIEVESNNISASTILKVGDPLEELVINEIMNYPLDSGQWLEIMNRGENPVDITGWKISNGKEESVLLATGSCELDINELLVVAESSEACLADIYGFTLGIVLDSIDIPYLRATSDDTVRLIDDKGFIVDEVRYAYDWIGSKGISLERISPDMASNDPDNWSTCVIDVGGTPGKENSIHLDSLPEKPILSVSPEVFSPDDPENPVTNISYVLPFTKAYVRLYVYNRQGICVRKLLEGQPSGAISVDISETGEMIWSHAWDGKNDHGKLLPMGIYIIYLQAEDQNSTKVITAKKTCVLAR